MVLSTLPVHVVELLQMRICCASKKRELLKGPACPWTSRFLMMGPTAGEAARLDFWCVAETLHGPFCRVAFVFVGGVVLRVELTEAPF